MNNHRCPACGRMHIINAGRRRKACSDTWYGDRVCFFNKKETKPEKKTRRRNGYKETGNGYPKRL